MYKEIIPEGEQSKFGILNEEQNQISEALGGDIVSMVALLGALVLFGKTYFDSAKIEKAVTAVSEKLNSIFGNEKAYSQLMGDVDAVYKGAYAAKMKSTIEKMKSEYDSLAGKEEDTGTQIDKLGKMKNILKKFSNLKVATYMKKEKGEE